MIKVVHLLDDFAMGGVTRALSLFDHPELERFGRSHLLPVSKKARLAPVLDADLIVTHFPPSWRRIPFLVSLRLRNPNARVVHVEHSYTAHFEARKVRSVGRFRKMLRLSLSVFDEVVCVSHAQADWLRRASRISVDRVHVIHPWSSRPELLFLPEPGLREEHAALRLAAYGRFAEPKNFASLVSAASHFAPGELELHIGGEGPDEAELHSLAKGRSNIVFHGRVRDVRAFLANCDAVVVPSTWEAFGLVATEARLAARAIMVADVDGLPEQVGPSGEAGVVARLDDPAAIVSAIQRLNAMPLREMGIRGRESARKMDGEILRQWRDVFARAYPVAKLRQLERSRDLTTNNHSMERGEPQNA